MKLNMKTFILLLIINYFTFSETLELCKTCEINSFNQAFNLLSAGDTLFIKEDVYQGGISFSNLKGKENDFIHVIGKDNVIIEGGNTAMQLSDCEYVEFKNIVFQKQNLNGVNIDDAGTFESPTHHINFIDCTFRDIIGTGNNDLLKLSGLDTFLIYNCKFENGSPGGSAVDMVGCHSGTISQNFFENHGSNSIQCKGGTSEILIEKNYFLNGGARAINLGGSTGLAFFRPQDANYEASNLMVYSNIFVGGETPCAFVGSEGVEVFNNSIINPTKWIFRILQETVDEDRFIECGDNSLINNLFYVNSNISFTPVNIGSNTRPETFDISDNLFYNTDNQNWKPNLIDINSNYLNINPMINQDYTSLDTSSSLVSKGQYLENPKYDFNSKAFLNPRSIGAIEGGVELVSRVYNKSDIEYMWNGDFINFSSKVIISEIYIYDLLGKQVLNKKVNAKEFGIYLIRNNYLIILKGKNTFNLLIN